MSLSNLFISIHKKKQSASASIASITKSISKPSSPAVHSPYSPSSYSPQISFPSEQNSLVFANLIDFSLCNDSIAHAISCLLCVGWILPNMYAYDTDKRYKCKIHEYVTCSTLTECLQYTFDSFLSLEIDIKTRIECIDEKSNDDFDYKENLRQIINNSYADNFEPSISGTKSKSEQTDLDTKWVFDIYKILMTSLTLRQKAHLLSIGTDRRNRKHLIYKYKDCIIGKEAVDWMILHAMAKSRKDAVKLGQSMLSKGYMSHISYDHNFEDQDLYYTFDDELIEMVKNNMDENMNDKPSLKPRESRKMATYQQYRLKKHNEIIQYLVKMTLNTDMEQKLLFYVQKAFVFTKNKAICKVVDNVSFGSMNETVEFILTELWEENYAQHMYCILINFVTLTQKAKLFSIGADRKDRIHHFKRYKNCFIATEGVQWLMNAKFVKSETDAIDLGNTFRHTKYIKCVHGGRKFKNENLFFTFDDGEIDKQCMMEQYMKQQILHKKLRKQQNQLININMSLSSLLLSDTNSCVL